MQGKDQRGGQGSTPMHVKSYVNKTEQSSYSASKLKDDTSDDDMVEEEYAEFGCTGAFQTQGQSITTGTPKLKGGYGKKNEFERYEQRDQKAFENQRRKELRQKDNVHSHTKMQGTDWCKDRSPVVEDMLVEAYAERGGKFVKSQSFPADRHISTKGRTEYDQRQGSWRTEQSDSAYMTSLERGRQGHNYQSESRKDSGKEGNFQHWNSGHSNMNVSKRNISHDYYQSEDNYRQHPHRLAMAEVEYSDHVYPSFIQKQTTVQRSKEASKQMLYGVFGNFISILEEFEERELEQRGYKQRMPRSQIPIPGQKHKSFNDIKRVVDGQLLLFENQTTAGKPEAYAELKNEMRRRTISWAAVRSEMGIEELHQTDIYISKLYEILAKGSTQQYIPERCNASPEIIKTCFEAVMKGNHDKETLDESFRADTNKKAIGPKTRSSERLTDGAHRIAMANGKRELDHHLQNDLERFQQEGPHDLK